MQGGKKMVEMTSEQILRIDGSGNVGYDIDWPYRKELKDVVADGRLRTIVTDFLRVGVKPEACRGSLESELEKLALSAALKAGSKMDASYVALSKNSIKEVESRATGDTVCATYVATFYTFGRNI
jgi:hypothetical protein